MALLPIVHLGFFAQYQRFFEMARKYFFLNFRFPEPKGEFK